MKKIIFMMLVWVMVIQAYAQQQTNEPATFKSSKDLVIKSSVVEYHQQTDQLYFTIKVEGRAGATVPTTFGQLDGAPVLGYVFPTSLSPDAVGFDKTEGILALALTSHPDFDDTPLWDENSDQDYGNDGVIWHPHWVVLVKDDRVPGGLSVKQFKKADTMVKLPPTNPGMPMYMDSPGFPVLTNGQEITVVIPAYRMNKQIEFNYDVVTAYMQVNTSNDKLPLLGVYNVYSVLSGDLSLPYTVKNR